MHAHLHLARLRRWSGRRSPCPRPSCAASPDPLNSSCCGKKITTRSSSFLRSGYEVTVSRAQRIVYTVSIDLLTDGRTRMWVRNEFYAPFVDVFDCTRSCADQRLIKCRESNLKAQFSFRSRDTSGHMPIGLRRVRLNPSIGTKHIPTNRDTI